MQNVSQGPYTTCSVGPCARPMTAHKGLCYKSAGFWDILQEAQELRITNERHSGRIEELRNLGIEGVGDLGIPRGLYTSYLSYLRVLCASLAEF